MNVNLQDAVWIDVNTNVTLNKFGDRLPDHLAIIHSSFFNMFRCHVGGRARTFEPEYGSYHLHYLQEPVSENTANALRVDVIQSVARWEPRIKLIPQGTYVIPDYDLPGFKIRIAFYMLQGADLTPKAVEFSVTQ